MALHCSLTAPDSRFVRVDLDTSHLRQGSGRRTGSKAACAQAAVADPLKAPWWWRGLPLPRGRLSRRRDGQAIARDR
jgi:hypothetical protein